MRKILAYVLIATSITLLVVVPVVFAFNIALGPDYYSTDLNRLLIGIFQDYYFTIFLGALMVGLYLLLHDATAGGAKTVQTADYVWMGVGLVAFIIHVLAYASTKELDSIFYQLYPFLPFLDFSDLNIIPNQSVGVAGPGLHKFTLWISFFVILLSIISMFGTFERMGFDKKKFGALLINTLIALGLALSLIEVPVVHILEEFFVSYRYQTTRNYAGSTNAAGEPYCPAPDYKKAVFEAHAAEAEKLDGQIMLVPRFPTPPGVRDDIEIIGIMDRDIEESQGKWPLDWGIYADVAARLGAAEESVLLFDISFLDNKGIFGGDNCGTTMDCRARAGQPLRRQVDVLAEAVGRSPQRIVADYPIEVTTESLDKLVEIDDRLNVLREKSGLINVKHGDYLDYWAILPKPPVASIGRGLDGIGFANVYIDPVTKINRKVPLVIRVPKLERMTSEDFQPVIDDDFLPGVALSMAIAYYGVDPVKDVEVDVLGGYVKIKNIPEKSEEKFNFETNQLEVVDIMAVPNADRTVTIPMDNQGLMNINFRGGLFCFPYQEIYPVARRKSPEDVGQEFRKKIALVAMYYATGVSTAADAHLSPYGTMAGIEHQAYAINTILNQDFAHDVPPIVDFMILLVIALLTGVFQPRVATWMSSLLTALIASAYVVFALYVTFGLYSYVHVLPTVLVEQVLVLLAFILFRALAEEENVKFIRNTFSKFVAQDVVDELLENPESMNLGGSKKEITVFFSDVRGFTTLSERLSAEELVSVLNQYLSEMTNLIIQYRGTVDKYMGDAIMAFWGAPAENPEHAYYTCVAAIGQYQKLTELRDEWKSKGGEDIDIGIGINTGMAVVGNMGSSARMDFTVMGDTINLGSRLEGITKTYGVKIVISEFTYERVKEKVWARELDLVRVKGKTEPVRIYELMGLKDETDLEKFKTGKIAAATV